MQVPDAHYERDINRIPRSIHALPLSSLQHGLDSRWDEYHDPELNTCPLP